MIAFLRDLAAYAVDRLRARATHYRCWRVMRGAVTRDRDRLARIDAELDGRRGAEPLAQDDAQPVDLAVVAELRRQQGLTAPKPGENEVVRRGGPYTTPGYTMPNDWT